VKLRFVITQHSCDIKLMKSLIKYFNCGRVEIAYERLHVNFVVPKFTDIEGKIIPFFLRNIRFKGLKIWT
jgi:LAGLIDADG endonuclease